MQLARAEDTADRNAALERVRIKSAGGLHEHFVLFITYAPSKGTKKRICSNDRRYRKSWASAAEITLQDKIDFVEWLRTGLARGGGSRKSRGDESTSLALRSSTRVETASVSLPFAGYTDFQVSQAVWACVRSLIEKVCRKALWHQEQMPARSKHCVPSKPRQHHLKTLHVKPRHPSATLEACYRRCRGMISKRYRAANLTQRRSRAYAYRTERLRRAAAFRAEENLQWLQHHQMRLATIIARQELLELLPEGG